MLDVLGRRDAVLAGPTRRAAWWSPAWWRAPTRRPIVVAVPTTAEAERLADDLAAYLGADAVELFPAWETLPFERVSPARRDDGPAPAGDVAAARRRRRGRRRWSWRRCGRWCSGSARTSRTSSRSSCGQGEQRRPRRAGRRLVARRLPARVPGRAPRRGRGARLDRRRVPVHRRRTRCASTCGATRSTGSPSSRSPTSARPTTSTDGRDLPVPRAAADRRGARPGRARSSAAEPWGREQWERLAEGQMFDGMESWLPWLTDDEHLLADLLAAERARCCCVEPRRMRDRAGELLAEEADLAAHAGRARGARRAATRRSRACTLAVRPAARRTPTRRRGRVTVAPDGPDVADGRGRRLGPGRRRRRRRSSSQLARPAAPTATAWSSPPTARARPRPRDRRRRCLARPRRSTPGRSWSSRRSSAGVHPAGAQARGGGRGRPHRPPPRPPPRRARARDAAGFFDDLKPGDYVVHHQHGVGRYGGMVKRAIGGVERDYLLLEYQGGDKLYVPVRPDRRRAPVHRRRRRRRCTELGGADCAEDQGAGARRGRARSPRSSSCSTSSGVTRPGHAFAPDTPWQHELEDAVPVRGDARPAQGDRRGEGRHGAAGPDGPPRVRRRRLRQDRGRDPRRVQGGAGRQAGRGARARPRCSRSSTARRSATASPATRCGSRCCRRFLTARRRPSRWSTGVRERRGRHRDRHPPAALRRHRSSRTSACSSSTRSSASACSTRRRSSSCATERRRAHAHRHADPAHARDEPHRHPRPLAAATRRPPTASRSSPTSASTTTAPSPRRSAASCCARARCSSCTTGCRTSSTWPSTAARAGARGARRGRPRADGRGHARAGRARLLGGRVRRARVHDDHRERHRHADGEHARRRPRRPARPRPAVPAARPRRPRRASGPTPTCSTRPTARSPRRPTSG